MAGQVTYWEAIECVDPCSADRRSRMSSQRGIDLPCTDRQQLMSSRMSTTHRVPPSPDEYGGAKLRAVSVPLPSTSKDGGNYDGCVGDEHGPGDKGNDHSREDDRCSAWADVAESISREAASSTEGAGHAYQCNSGNDDGALSSHTDGAETKVFVRRSLSPNKLRGCCDRCKSDLNGKLLARCSVCGFCRHLYCFSPPLKQHPALEERAAPKRRVSAMVAQSMIAQWKCGTCARNLAGRAPPSPQKERLHTETPQRDAATLLRASKKRLRQAPSPVNGPSSSPRHLVNVPTNKLPPQVEHGQSPADGAHSDPSLERSESKVDEKPAAEFDWYKFRSEKAARVLSQAGNKDELVYYSRSVGLMRKTARFWYNYVQQKKLRSHLNQQRLRWATGPQIYDVKHVLSEEDRVKLEASHHRRKMEETETIRLFTDANASVPYYRPPRRETVVAALNGEPTDDDVTSERVTETVASAVADLLLEMVTAIAMAEEDVDVPGELPSSEVYGSSHLSILGLQLAAKVIQRLLRARQHARDRARRVERQDFKCVDVAGDTRDREDGLKEEEKLELERRRGRAHALLTHLALCARCLGVLVTKFRQRQTKKELVSLLADPAPRPVAPDDTMPIGDKPDEISAAERSRVAQRHIFGFFRKYVGPRIYRRKLVMARRIQQWWRLTTRRRKWSVLAASYRLHMRDAACRHIQRLYRGYKVKRKFQVALEKLALKRLQLFLRQWIMSRLIKKERERVDLYNAAMRLSVAPDGMVQRPEASMLEILDEVGMALYSAGDFWSAAFVFEKFTKAKGSLDVADFEFMVPFAYSHHMTWYSSYDSSNLMRAHDLYCSALEYATKNRASSDASSVFDPDILQDLALVKMHVGDTVGSLRLLAKLIEFFPHEPSFPLWLLLAAVQMQQRGDWEQSVQYLTYVQDIPPAPYLERDVLVLCAIGLQRCSGETSDTSKKEAWRAALRLWSMDKKTREDEMSQRGRHKAQSTQARLKWEVATDLAQRALGQGHYLLAIQTYTFAMTRYAETADSYEAQTAWWDLSDAYRHLGKLELYLQAAARSHESGGVKQQDESLVATWREHAERSSRSFQEELQQSSAIRKLQQLTAQP